MNITLTARYMRTLKSRRVGKIPVRQLRDQWKWGIVFLPATHVSDERSLHPCHVRASLHHQMFGKNSMCKESCRFFNTKYIQKKNVKTMWSQILNILPFSSRLTEDKTMEGCWTTAIGQDQDDCENKPWPAEKRRNIWANINKQVLYEYNLLMYYSYWFDNVQCSKFNGHIEKCRIDIYIVYKLYSVYKHI